MAKHSAGILLYRRTQSILEFLLVHPGGPFWAKKDVHAWSFPKGETDADDISEEVLLATARREFAEETGAEYTGPLIPLPEVKVSGGKILHAFLAEGNFDPSALVSNTFEMEWPPKSGRKGVFPEVDKAGWFDPETALEKIHKGQIPVIEHALELLR